MQSYFFFQLFNHRSPDIRRIREEQNDLTPIVEAYKEYKSSKQAIEDSLLMLEEESDEEMRELAKEELNDSKKRVEELERELKILLLPKDPNDEKNVIVEIRAGAGGDEAPRSPAYCFYILYMLLRLASNHSVLS